jgi:hypothetical protein
MPPVVFAPKLQRAGVTDRMVVRLREIDRTGDRIWASRSP